MSGLVHGLRARKHLAVPALGEVNAELRRSLDSPLRLRRARTEDLPPGDGEAEQPQADLEATLAGLRAPSEPRVEKIVPFQKVVTSAANDDAPPLAVAPPEPTGTRLLRECRSPRAEFRPGMGEGLAPGRRERMVEAAREEEAAVEAEGRDRESLYAVAKLLLAADCGAPRCTRGAPLAPAAAACRRRCRTPLPACAAPAPRICRPAAEKPDRARRRSTRR